MGSMLQRSFPWKRECDQSIGDLGAKGSSSAGGDDNKLFACLFAKVRDWRGVSVGFESRRPQFFSRVCIEGAKMAVGSCPDKYQAAAHNRAAQIWCAGLHF